MSKLGDKKVLRIYAKHLPYDGHLAEVVSDMKRLGPPTISVVDYRGDFFAVEGSHRLAAAHYLGLIPKINVLDQDRLGPEGEEYLDKIKTWIPSYTWLMNE